MTFNSAFDTFISGLSHGTIAQGDAFSAYLLATGGGGGTTAVYTFSKTHSGMNHPQIPTGQNRVGPVSAVITDTNQGWSANPMVFVSVPANTVAHAVIVYKHVTDGESVTDLPCFYYANFTPVTADGNNIIVSANAQGLWSGRSQ